MSSFWHTNLEHLQRRGDEPTLSLHDALVRRGPEADSGVRDRQGRRVPSRDLDGRKLALSSTFDAIKEGQRWAAEASGTLAVWGSAGVEAARAMLDSGVSLVFWVEPRIDLWSSLMTWEDWGSIVADPRWIPVLEAGPRWTQLLLTRYHPLWNGGWRSLAWRAAVQGCEALWNTFSDEARSALEVWSSDASTQARFAERWYRNTLCNLRDLAEASFRPPRAGFEAAIAGAGPSLDDALERSEDRMWLSRRAEEGNLLLSTDTALPALVRRGWVPDAVFCLDGQLPSYHHFVAARPVQVPLIADIASIPLTGRLGMNVVRFLSGHPFSAVVQRYFPELPVLDGSLGNVSGLIWRTSQALGASEIRLWGVDFAYRNGQAYAHGTYVEDLAQRRATRLTPLETRLGLSTYAAHGRERTWDQRGQPWDTTPILREYRRRWDSVQGAVPSVALSHQAAGPRWQAFARDWHRRLNQLVAPSRATTLHESLALQPLETRQDWQALLPLAFAAQRRGKVTLDALLHSRDHALGILEQFLS